MKTTLEDYDDARWDMREFGYDPYNTADTVNQFQSRPTGQ